jgi:hypothetical protein
MSPAVDVSYLQKSNVEQDRRIRILRRALLHAQSQFCVTQILNPDLNGKENIQDVLDIIQRAMRYQEEQ